MIYELPRIRIKILCYLWKDWSNSSEGAEDYHKHGWAFWDVLHVSSLSESRPWCCKSSVKKGNITVIHVLFWYNSLTFLYRHWKFIVCNTNHIESIVYSFLLVLYCSYMPVVVFLDDVLCSNCLMFCYSFLEEMNVSSTEAELELSMEYFCVLACKPQWHLLFTLNLKSLLLSQLL